MTHYKYLTHIHVYINDTSYTHAHTYQ